MPGCGEDLLKVAMGCQSYFQRCLRRGFQGSEMDDLVEMVEHVLSGIRRLGFSAP